VDAALIFRKDTLWTPRADTRKAVQEHERHMKPLSDGGHHPYIRLNRIYIPIMPDDISSCGSEAGEFP
jgi:hypothetical protein